MLFEYIQKIAVIIFSIYNLTSKNPPKTVLIFVIYIILFMKLRGNNEVNLDFDAEGEHELSRRARGEHNGAAAFALPDSCWCVARIERENA